LKKLIIKNKIKSLKSFTLAETLITLLIIGIVAILTIKSLISYTSDLEIRSSWKKDFSTLSQAIQLLRNDNGGTLLGLCAGGDHTCFKNALAPYLSYLKACDMSSSTTQPGGCWHIYNGDGTFQAKYLSGDAVTTSHWLISPAGFVLKNGHLLYISWYKSDCKETGYGPNALSCGYISVDVNGFKGPNTVGKDIFETSVRADVLKPIGSMDDNFNNSCSGAGYGCAAKYLE